ncbi:MAG: hypothetical protein L0Y58_25430 [Verrucomicrobia subdivision 3 bacterium]|nr:hypothetical protein [Gemmataceae bacterium]MCI0748764.1 hypothetical protein [Limisphaerales bacterium]
MNDAPRDSQDAPPRDNEYQDPQYHDEDLEIQNDEQPHSAHRHLPKRKTRWPQPKRRYVED